VESEKLGTVCAIALDDAKTVDAFKIYKNHLGGYSACVAAVADEPGSDITVTVDVEILDDNSDAPPVPAEDAPKAVPDKEGAPAE